jgi:hypothetical protein
MLMLLVQHMADRRELLPFDIEELRRALGVRTRDEERELDRVLSIHFCITEGGRGLLDRGAIAVPHQAVFNPVGVTSRPGSVTSGVTSDPQNGVTGKEANRERQKRYRARCEPIRIELMARGLTPRKNALFGELMALLDVTPPRNATTAGVTPSVTHGLACAEFLNTIPNTEQPREREARASNADAVTPTETPAFTPSPAGLICRAMRLAGMAEMNPSHPDLIALIEAGVTADEMADVARETIAKGKGFAYALAVARGRRRDTATAGPIPAKADALAAWAGPDLAARLRGGSIP